MCILGAVFFLIFFGGKMEHIWTDVTNRITNKKKQKKNKTWSMHIRTAPVFFFLAGKFLTCEKPMSWIISQQKKIKSN